MDDLSRGLGLLPEKLAQLSRQMDQLTSQVAELRAESAQKAAGSDVERLRQQLSGLTAATTRGLETEANRLNRLESKLRKATERGAGSPRSSSPGPARGYGGGGDGAEAMTAAAAVALRVERLEKHMQAMGEVVAQKAEQVEIIRMDEQVQSMTDVLVRAQRVVDLHDGQLQKALEEAEARSKRRLQDLEEGALHQLRLGQDRLGASVRELREVVASKVEGESSVCEQLNAQHRSLSTSLSQKAEWSEVEQLRIQLRALSGNMTQQAEAQATETENLNSRVQVLSTSVSTACNTQPGHNEELKDLSAALELKADKSRVEKLVQQLTTMSDIVATKLSARPQCRRPSSRSGF